VVPLVRLERTTRGLGIRPRLGRYIISGAILKIKLRPKIVSERLGHATVDFILYTYSHMWYLDCRKQLQRHLII